MECDQMVYFSTVLLMVHTLLPLMLQCLNPIDQKNPQQQIWYHQISFSAHPHKPTNNFFTYIDSVAYQQVQLITMIMVFSPLKFFIWHQDWAIKPLLVDREGKFLLVRGNDGLTFSGFRGH